MTQLTEGLDYHDLKGQINPKITIDEYAAKMGKDEDIVTVTFMVNSKLAAQDLTSWLELGYNFILDASVSTGEVSAGKYLVFMELKRRSKVVEQIIEVLKDLKTLTDMPLKKWKIEIGDKLYPADEAQLKKVIPLYPRQYRREVEGEDKLEEMKQIAGLDLSNNYEQDPEIKDFKAIAGL